MIFTRPESAIVVDKTQKRSGVYIRLWYLDCSLCTGRHTSLEASQKDVYIRLGIQRVEKILHVGLY